MSNIQLFSFRENEIRTTSIGQDVWFAAQDVFKALNLTWKGARDLRTRQISESWTIKRGGETFGGPQEMIFVNEKAVYKLAFRANKSEQADEFTNWVVELLVRIRKGLDKPFDNPLSDLDALAEHTKRPVQVENSKNINGHLIRNWSVETAIRYNREHCKLVTGKEPTEIKKIGKSIGLKSVQRSSAKEVLRNLRPELAAQMSINDYLVEHGRKLKAANDLTTPCVPLLNELIEVKRLKA